MPFRLRKDFSKIKSNDLIILQKLEQFFLKFSDVKMSEFFAAPYKIYVHDDRFELKFYTTQKAIYVYNLWKKSQLGTEADTQLNTSDHESNDEKC